MNSKLCTLPHVSSMAVEIDWVLVSPCSSDSASFVMVQHKMLPRFLMHSTSVTSDDVSQTKKSCERILLTLLCQMARFRKHWEKGVRAVFVAAFCIHTTKQSLIMGSHYYLFLQSSCLIKCMFLHLGTATQCFCFAPVFWEHVLVLSVFYKLCRTALKILTFSISVIQYYLQFRN